MAPIRDQLQQVMALVFWIVGMMFKVLLIFVPHQLPVSSSSVLSPLLERKEGVPCAIFKALNQVLALMNEIPASSHKYMFTRELAEKILEENAADGLEGVNRQALEAAFARTVSLLAAALNDLLHQRQISGMGCMGKLLKNLPLSSVPTLPLLTNVIGSSTQTQQSVAPAGAVSSEEASEKYCEELLWIAQKLKEISAIEAAIAQWTYASRLSILCHSASVRVQKLLLKLCAFLCMELASTDCAETKRKFLVLWMPLFCNVLPSAPDGTLFTASQKLAIVNIIEKIITSIPDNDQEMVLSIWLREFSVSSSDWPNLQRSYDRWCQQSRRLDTLKLAN